MDEKKELERAALREFIHAYNQEHENAPIEFDRLADPPEPDCIARIGKTEIGIEVAHIFGTDFDARNTLGRAGDLRTMRSDPETWNAHISNTMIPVPDRIVPALNRLLEEKARKRYGRRCWLLIRNGAFMMWGKVEFENHHSSIRVPSHKFEQIWLLCGRDAVCGLLRLA